MQAGAARSLLAGMAPVDSVDWRGNGPLHWAVAGGSAGSLASLVTTVTSLAHSGTTAYTHLPWEARNNQEHWEKAELDPCFSSSFLLNTS